MLFGRIDDRRIVDDFNIFEASRGTFLTVIITIIVAVATAAGAILPR